MHYRIVKWKNYGFINPKPEGILASTLDKYLQYERQGSEFMPNPEWAKVRLYSTKKGMFPWGLLKVVKNVMNKYCAGQHTYFIEYTPWIGELEKDIAGLRPYQKEAIKALLKNGGGIVCLPTGSGKTLMMVEYIKILGLNTLVIVPTLDIKRQWEEYDVPNTRVSTYQNPKLKDEMEQYGLIIFDECHHLPSRTIYTLAMKVRTESVLVGCSASVTREDGEDMKINAALGELIYNIPRSELIKQGWIANAEVIYLRPKFSNAGRYMDYQEIYNKLIVHNDSRNKLIVNTALKESDRKVLILVSVIEHGQILYDMLRNDCKAIFMNGNSKDRNPDMSKYDVIVATPIYDEGYNLPELDCLILAAGGQSGTKLVQRVGRVLRIKPDGRLAKIYDFVDTPHYLRTHYMKRRGLLSEDFEIIDIEG